jgi:hypothetical protein
MQVHYDNKKIELIYSSWFPSDKKNFLAFRVKSGAAAKLGFLEIETNDSKEYAIAEQEAQIYLIKNAVDNLRAGCNLIKIVDITQEIICNPCEENIELKIILSGIAISKKSKIKKSLNTILH